MPKAPIIVTGNYYGAISVGDIIPYFEKVDSPWYAPWRPFKIIQHKAKILQTWPCYFPGGNSYYAEIVEEVD